MSLKINSLLAKTAILLILPLLVRGQQNKYSECIDSYMQALVKFNDFSGVVLVAKNDTVYLKKAYGYADRESKVLNQVNTKFRIASVTKPFTAAAILILEQQGKLSLANKLSKYISGFEKGDDITIHMLLSHRSGIADYAEDKDLFMESKGEYSAEIMLEKIRHKKILYNPGTDYSYSNSNYYLLGIIIEKITGMSYQNFIQKNIFSPLGMLNSGLAKNNLVISEQAKGYDLIKGKIAPAKYIKLEAAYSAGAIYSTVDDLYKWGQSLDNTSILSKDSKTKMFTPYSFNIDGERYGYGMIIDSFLSEPRLWHSGGINGFTAQFVKYRKDSATIIILSNQNGAIDNSRTSDAIIAILNNIPVENPYLHKEVKQNTADLNKYVGNYTSYGKYSNSEQLQIILDKGRLYRKKTGSKDVELIPEGDGEFFYKGNSDKYLKFVTDKNGNFESINFFYRDIQFNTWKRNQQKD